MGEEEIKPQKTNLQLRKQRLKLIWISLCVLSPILLTYSFIVFQRNNSFQAYQDSRQLVNQYGGIIDLKDLLHYDKQLDEHRQDRFLSILQSSNNWPVFPATASYLTDEFITFPLSQKQIDWLNDPTAIKDIKKLSSLMQEGPLFKSSYAWLYQHINNPENIRGDDLISRPIYSFDGDAISQYLTCQFIQKSIGLQELLIWRNIHTQADSLYYINLNTEHINLIDNTLLMHSIYYEFKKVPSLQIIHPKQTIIQALEREPALFVDGIARCLNEIPLSDYPLYFSSGHRNELINFARCYLWGHRDCAAINNSYAGTLRILTSNAKEPIQSIITESHSSVGDFLLSNLQGLCTRVYELHARQRIVQLSILINQHKLREHTVPNDQQALLKLFPIATDLCAGDRFSFRLHYTRLSNDSFSIAIDSSHIPDSFDPSTLRIAPSSTTEVLMIEPHFALVDFSRK